jgi:hypothetical protein
MNAEQKTKYLKMLSQLLIDIDKIDEDTVYEISEPTWWLEMMQLRGIAQNLKNRNKKA